MAGTYLARSLAIGGSTLHALTVNTKDYYVDIRHCWYWIVLVLLSSTRRGRCSPLRPRDRKILGRRSLLVLAIYLLTEQVWKHTRTAEPSSSSIEPARLRMPSTSHGLESRRATTRSACAPLLASALARSVGGEYIASTRARFWEVGLLYIQRAVLGPRWSGAAMRCRSVGYAAQASGGVLGTAGHRVLGTRLGRGNKSSLPALFKTQMVLAPPRALAYSRYCLLSSIRMLVSN